LNPSLLVLCPTELERQRLQGDAWSSDVDIDLCGFGPIAAAARTAELISMRSPKHVLLLGIAGGFAEAGLNLGAAYQFKEVVCDSLGAGQGDHYQPAAALGFHPWEGSDSTPKIGVRLSLAADSNLPTAPLLVTTATASGDSAHAVERRSQFPNAAAEDMEGYGVAFACAMQGIPCTIVRGISNQVGNRNHAEWQIEPALESVRKLCIDLKWN